MQRISFWAGADHCHAGILHQREDRWDQIAPEYVGRGIQNIKRIQTDLNQLFKTTYSTPLLTKIFGQNLIQRKLWPRLSFYFSANELESACQHLQLLSMTLTLACGILGPTLAQLELQLFAFEIVVFRFDGWCLEMTIHGWLYPRCRYRGNWHLTRRRDGDGEAGRAEARVQLSSLSPVLVVIPMTN